MSKFNIYLKHKLEQNNLSQNKFAKMIGVSPTYVGDMINGRKGPPDKELQIKFKIISKKRNPPDASLPLTKWMVVRMDAVEFDKVSFTYK